MPSPDPGSFRDPTSRVYRAGDQVFRGLSHGALVDHEAVAAAPFFAELVRERAVVESERVGSPPAELAEWAGVLKHRRIDPITYPFEWSFEMLRDAALLHLDIARRALRDGFAVKDASAYNIQFEGARPVFIDIGSFEVLRRGEPWSGYRQACELFLNPLVVQALAGIPFQPWLRGSIHGIAPSDAAAVVRGRRRLHRGILTHVVLHARADARFADSDRERDIGAELKRAGFGPKIIDAQLRNLERTIGSLRWKAQTSTWAGYSDRAHYTDADLAQKEAVVRDEVGRRKPALVLDLGANDGHFSRLAVDSGAGRAVAVDSDHLVVDRLYRQLRDAGEHRILPLVLDLTDPSPGIGWRNRERAPFVERVRPDLVLCLAVVHHLALTGTVPFDEIVALLADLAAPVVVELPHRDDPMAARLLARKRAGLFDHYDVPQWEAALRARFTIEATHRLAGGTRTLYCASPR